MGSGCCGLELEFELLCHKKRDREKCLPQTETELVNLNFNSSSNDPEKLMNP